MGFEKSSNSNKIDLDLVHAFMRMQITLTGFFRQILTKKNRSVSRRVADGYGFESYLRDSISYCFEDWKEFYNKRYSESIYDAAKRVKKYPFNGFVAREVMYKDILGNNSILSGKKRADLCIWDRRDAVLHIAELKILSRSSILRVVADLNKLDSLLNNSNSLTKIYWIVVICKESDKNTSVDNLKKLSSDNWTVAGTESMGDISVVFLRRKIKNRTVH